MKKQKSRLLEMMSGENTNWQTMSDVLTALLLIVLLINMILILYIVCIPDEDLVDDEWGDHDDHGGYEYYSRSPSPSPSPTVTHFFDYPWHDDGGGGGGGGTHTPTPTTAEPTIEPTVTPSFVPALYPEGEGVEKAAVYVLVIDAETQRAIKEQGIEFDLVDHRNVLQILRTYYPVTTTYRLFETTNMGFFYLPEKIGMGTYKLRELTEPWGYDASDPIEFIVDTAYDWPEPLIIKVPLYPSRNVIMLQMNDAVTGAGVGGCVYEVAAAEAIMTADGTLRHAEGDIVGEITLHDDGHGESMELFLGQYTLRQITAPLYYAADPEPLTVTVGKKQGEPPADTHVVTSQKTTVSVALTDELYDNVGIPGIEFILTSGNPEDPYRTLSTDTAGLIEISNLQKDTRYVLRQTSLAENYLAAAYPLEFTVDALGLIDGEVRVQKNVCNRMIRVSISVKDSLFGFSASDYNIALYDAQGGLVKSWNSTGLAQQLDGLAPGTYTLVVGGKNSMQITVKDTAELQTFSPFIWSGTSLLLVIGGGALAIAALIITLVVVIRRKRRLKNN